MPYLCIRFCSHQALGMAYLDVECKLLKGCLCNLLKNTITSFENSCTYIRYKKNLYEKDENNWRIPGRNYFSFLQ